jgi:hypothetical protein
MANTDDQARYDRDTLNIGYRMSSRDEENVARILKRFSELQLWRATFGAQWEEVAELILPTSRNTFYYGNFNWPGEKKTNRQIDATGMMALHRFAAICDSLLTPRNMMWQSLAAIDPYLMKDRDTRLWFEEATRTLFKYRYAPVGNFVSQNQSYFQNLGAFGNGGVFVDAPDPAFGIGLRYLNIPLGEIFITENHQKQVDGFIRWFRLTARQAKRMFPDTFPPELNEALANNSEWPYDFLHVVEMRDPSEYDPQRLDMKGKKWASYYICMHSKTLLREGGYRTFPLAYGRYEQTPGEMYGRSPAMMILPALKTLNAQKTTFLKQGHRAADPVLLTTDDGIVDFNMRPGALNKGGVNSQGHMLVQPLPTGNIQISKEMMQEERQLINDAFLVSLFQILTETPQMTATEVIERTNEKGILLAPTVGRQDSEYIGPLTDRELDVLSQQRLLPPMPGLLREARGQYQTVSRSPLSRAMRAQEAAGFMRTVENVKELVSITGDQSLLDPFDFDTAIPAIAEIQNVPESWMAGPQQIAAKRQRRAKAMQAQQQIQAMPAQAAMMKAQAVAGQAQGQGTPGPVQPGVPIGQPQVPQGPQ